MESLEERVGRIEKRNKMVEIDKAWETSWTRRLLLIVFTYISIGLYFTFISLDRPWINAVVPSLGFLLSTLTLPFFKGVWKKYFYALRHSDPPQAEGIFGHGRKVGDQLWPKDPSTAGR